VNAGRRQRDDVPIDQSGLVVHVFKRDILGLCHGKHMHDEREGVYGTAVALETGKGQDSGTERHES